MAILAKIAEMANNYLFQMGWQRVPFESGDFDETGSNGE